MKMDIRNFFKKGVVSSSEVRVSEDISEIPIAQNDGA